MGLVSRIIVRKHILSNIDNKVSTLNSLTPKTRQRNVGSLIRYATRFSFHLCNEWSKEDLNMFIRMEPLALIFTIPTMYRLML
jgi:hypothetical protein